MPLVTWGEGKGGEKSTLEVKERILDLDYNPWSKNLPFSLSKTDSKPPGEVTFSLQGKTFSLQGNLQCGQ